MFGYLDYESISAQINWSINFVKDINIGKLFYGATGSTNADVTISIEEFLIRIPKITPTNEMESKLLKELTLDKKSYAAILDRFITEKSIGTETILTWEISTITNNPRYIILGFKDPAIANNILHNNSKFINFKGNNKIKSIQILVDNVRYPLNKIEIDGTKGNVYEAYDSTKRICNQFGNICPFDIHDFNQLNSLFAFDLTAQEELRKKSGLNIKVKIEKDTALELTAYALLLIDDIKQIDYKKGTIISEIK